MSDKQRAREDFGLYLAALAFDNDDLDTAIWAEMTERLTPRQVADQPFNAEFMQREMAIVLYRALRYPYELTAGDRNLLAAMISALLDPTKEWQLRLGRPRAGRAISYFSQERRFEKMRQLVEQVEAEVSAGEKVEAAIAQAIADFGVSRTTAFRAWERRATYREWHDRADKVESAFVSPEDTPVPNTGLWARIMKYLSPTFPPIR